MNAGDFALGSTFDVKFTTIDSTGAPITLAGTPVISAYPDNSTTQLTAGITLSVDFDTVTGLHNVRVVASSGNGYAAGSSYALVITTGTVDSVSVVGYVVAHFTIERGAAFGRLGAPAGASVSADVAAIKAETASILTDTGTTLQAELDAIQAAVITNAAGTDIAADIIALKAVADAVLVDTGTTLQAEVDAIQAAVITNAAGVDIAADIIALKAVADAVLVDTGTTLDAALAVVDGNVDSILVDTGTTLQAELDAIQAAVITNAAGVDIAADIIAIKAETAAILADTVEIGAAGAGLTEAGGTGDHLTALATAANLATVDTVVDAILVDTGTTLDGLITTVDTVVDAIKVQTDKLTFTVANQVDANTQYINDTAITGDGGATPWGPA